MIDALIVVFVVLGFFLAGWSGLESLVRLWRNHHPTQVVFKQIICDHTARENEGMQVWIDCPSCGQRHRASLVLYDTNPPEGQTHWYFCPVSRDPVSASVSLKVG